MLRDFQKTNYQCSNILEPPVVLLSVKRNLIRFTHFALENVLVIFMSVSVLETFNSDFCKVCVINIVFRIDFFLKVVVILNLLTSLL